MRGVGPTPVTKIRDHLARHGRVVLVDEYEDARDVPARVQVPIPRR